MKTSRFTIPPMPKIDFTITHIEIDKTSSLNQHALHIHKECEIYLNLSGDVSFEVENRIYPISRGSVIITRPFEHHRCIYHSDALHEHYWITFSAEVSDDFLMLFFNRKKGQDNLIRLNQLQLEACLDALDALLKNNGDLLERRIDFCNLLRILSNGQSANSNEAFAELSNDLVLALRFMDDHLTEDFGMCTLANSCNVSINTLEKHFKKTFGITPSQMLRNKRLICSACYLRNGETVTSAAMKSGFSDYSNYIQLFRKQFGETPLQYKKRFE